jgi:predicted phage terminase large subunit-like protein
MGIDDDGYTWILDAVMGQYDPDERDRIIRQTAVLDGVRVRIRLPQDPGQAGKSQKIHLMRLLQGYSVTVVPVTGDKVVRSEPFAAAVAGGMVRIVRGEWTSSVMEQWRQFPVGKHDDAIDAAADAYTELTHRNRTWGAV